MQKVEGSFRRSANPSVDNDESREQWADKRRPSDLELEISCGKTLPIAGAIGPCALRLQGGDRGADADTDRDARIMSQLVAKARLINS